ncbi:MAG: sodium:solute symporter family protein [Gemmatimonadota bacterium]|nr:sodium:solute symporter family protein [Gemmatimonadota bacterium]MDH5758332.1 sodium:solute symporter family protein [Gemmatimonadota bacterium]
MSIQVTVFAAYFVVVFAIGWLSLRRTRTEEDYWIAGGRLGWFIGGATVAATHTSAGTFVGTIGVMYTAGWSFGWVLLSIPLAYWFVAAVLAPRFTRVRQLTLPAFMEDRYYSKGVRGLAAGIVLIATVVYIQAQIVAGGLIANIVFGVPTEWGMLGFTGILLAYTVIGGMIAVVYTDAFQLVVMLLGVLFALPLAVRQTDGLDNLLYLVESAHPMVFSWGTLPGTLLFTMGLAFFLGSIATPERLIRLYAMKDMKTIRRGMLFALVAITGINLIVFVLALAAIVLFPALPTGDLAMPMVATAVLPPTLGAVMLAAITAAMMSTVDSLLIVAGSALSVDIYQNLIHPDVTPRRRMVVDRMGIVVVGSVPVILLLSGVGEGELVQFIVLLFSALMASSFVVPVVGGVLWRRATKEGAAAAMLGGVSTTLTWEAYGPEHIDPVLPGFLVSAVLWTVVSLLTPPPPRGAVDPYFSDAVAQEMDP